MQTTSKAQLLLVIFATSATPSLAYAAISGLTLGTYEYNQGDAGTPPVVGADSIQLTTGAGQRRSLFFTAPQDITEFTASFTYRAPSIAASSSLQGLAFVLQNSSSGVDALSTSAGTLGYAGISPSAAVAFQLDTGSARTFNAFYTNGVIGGGEVVTTPVNAFDGLDINVTVSYQNSVLSVILTESPTASFTRNYLVGSLASLLVGSQAYVGFTASTGDFGVNQFLSDFNFINSAVPEPAATLLFGSGILGLIVRHRRQRR